jgi:LysM repeat protein
LGETLESIAQEYNSSRDELMMANKLEDDALILDMFLLIPVSKDLFETLLNK